MFLVYVIFSHFIHLPRSFPLFSRKQSTSHPPDVAALQRRFYKTEEQQKSDIPQRKCSQKGKQME